MHVAFTHVGVCCSATFDFRSCAFDFRYITAEATSADSVAETQQYDKFGRPPAATPPPAGGFYSPFVKSNSEEVDCTATDVASSPATCVDDCAPTPGCTSHMCMHACRWSRVRKRGGRASVGPASAKQFIWLDRARACLAVLVVWGFTSHCVCTVHMPAPQDPESLTRRFIRLLAVDCGCPRGCRHANKRVSNGSLQSIKQFEEEDRAENNTIAERRASAVVHAQAQATGPRHADAPGASEALHDTAAAVEAGEGAPLAERTSSYGNALDSPSVTTFAAAAAELAADEVDLDEVTGATDTANTAV